MPLTDEQRRMIEGFRRGLEAHADEALDAGSPEREDREDESTLAMRWPAGEHVWYELAVRPFLPQVRVGILTDDRWKSEELEQVIEDSGDTMSEFVELGFETAGVDWPEPPVEHYRDRGKYFYFATPLDLESIEEIADPSVQDKVRRMLEGYRHAFGGAEKK